MLHVEGPVRDPSEETVRAPLAQWLSVSTSGGRWWAGGVSHLFVELDRRWDEGSLLP